MNVHTNTHTELKKGFVVVVVIVLWGKECGGGCGEEGMQRGKKWREGRIFCYLSNIFKFIPLD